MHPTWIALAIGSAVPLLLMRALDNATSHRTALQYLGIGCLLAIPASVVENQLEALMKAFNVAPAYRHVIYAFVVAALIEETARFFAVDYISRWRKTTRALDVLRIAIWISLGFSILENAVYVAISRPENMIRTASVRALFPTFMHVFCGIIVAAAVAKLLGSFSICFYAVAIAFHGVYDWIALASPGSYGQIVLVLAAQFVLSATIVRMIRVRDAALE
jgi:RsiW-degrading membrane proteinase PrsW (M82 family)